MENTDRGNLNLFNFIYNLARHACVLSENAITLKDIKRCWFERQLGNVADGKEQHVASDRLDDARELLAPAFNARTRKAFNLACLDLQEAMLVRCEKIDAANGRANARTFLLTAR